jgi:DNA topoisomerase I
MKPRHTASSTQLAPAAAAKAAGLHYVSDAQPGVRRIKAGAGFRFENASGKRVRDEVTLKRIRSLVIPPAWTDVWICPREDGHLQATGRDAKGRKQFRYHPLWREVRDATKYDRMIEFGEALPRIRRRVARNIAKPGLSREKVLATVVRLIDLTFIRVGNDEYAKQNDSYGLTTMQDKHARVRGERVEFCFRGKSGKEHAITIQDGRLAKIVKRCQDIPGQELFQWIDEEGKHRDVTSGDVNEYLREISESDFTAKDFRTWAGTVLVARALKTTADFQTERQGKKNLKQAIDAVAVKLGNTPAVCRKCYVHPSVLHGYLAHQLPCNSKAQSALSILPGENLERAGDGSSSAGTGTRRNAGGRLKNGTIKASKHPATSLGCDERQVLDFLRCCRREEKLKAGRLAPKLAKVPESWRPRQNLGTKARRR